jgi:uncharacterized membrane protein YtjA (UPF0391 family)
MAVEPKPGLSVKTRKEPAMSLLKWALIFLLISLVAALFGFTGISAATADIARILFFIFVVIFLVLLSWGLPSFEFDASARSARLRYRSATFSRPGAGQTAE